MGLTSLESIGVGVLSMAAPSSPDPSAGLSIESGATPAVGSSSCGAPLSEVAAGALVAAAVQERVGVEGEDHPGDQLERGL